jgi:hypothetical protein
VCALGVVVMGEQQNRGLGLGQRGQDSEFWVASC